MALHASSGKPGLSRSALPTQIRHNRPRPMDLETELTGSTCFQRLTHVASCDSTQALAERDPFGGCAVFWSDHQSAGRGREGREWLDSPAEDLAVTFQITGLALQSPTHLAAAIPIAAIESINSIVPETRIKWPNDLLLHGRKLCGILIDSHGHPNDTHLVGIGMNINRSAFPPELVEQSTSLALITGREFDRAERVLCLAQAIDRVITQIAENDLESLASAFAAYLKLSGQRVQATTGDRTIHGVLTALNLDRIVLDDHEEIPLAHLRSLAPD